MIQMIKRHELRGNEYDMIMKLSKDCGGYNHPPNPATNHSLHYLIIFAHERERERTIFKKEKMMG